MDEKDKKSELPQQLHRLLVTQPVTPPAPNFPFASPPSAAPEEHADQGHFTAPAALPPISTFDHPPGPLSVPSSSSSKFPGPRLPPVHVRRDSQHLYRDTRQIHSIDPGPSLPHPPFVEVPTNAITRSMSSLSLPRFPSSRSYAAPIYSDPQYRDVTTRPERFYHDPHHSYAITPEVYSQSSVREQEAGPSLPSHPSSYEQTRSHARGRRGSSQPAQTTRQLEPYSAPDYGSDGERGEFHLEQGQEDYPGMMGHPTQPYSSWSGSYPQSTLQAAHVRADIVSPQSQMTGYPTSATSLGPSSHLGWAPSGSGVTLDFPTGYSPVSVSDGSSDGRPEDEGDETYSPAQTGQKRRSESIAGDDSSKKGRSTRKTAVACNFCRGRKLRCNGAKPACSNCIARKFQCEYVPVQRRRGPGKAPKGTRPKRGSTTATTTTATSRPEASLSSVVPSDRPSGMMPEPLTLRMSVDTAPFLAAAPTDISGSGIGPPPPSSLSRPHDRSSQGGGTRTPFFEEKRGQ